MRKKLHVVLLALLLPAACAQEGGTLRLGVIVPEETAGPAGELARDVRQGAEFAFEEFEFNAMLTELDLQVEISEAGDAEAAVAAAAALAAAEGGLDGLAGGFDHATALALSEWAEGEGIPFINLGAPADSLRGDECASFTFHVAPSAAMYLDAIGGFYVRANFRDWTVVVGADEESQAQLERTRWLLENRHFGAEISGTVTFDPADPEAAARAAAESSADLVLLLLPADDQLSFLAAYEKEGGSAETTGFPWPEAQTRAFYLAAEEAAPGSGAGRRVTAWSATLELYGARELNARYLARWDEPMQFGAWSAYQAIKIFFEANTFAPGLRGAELRDYLGEPETVYDVWKGIGSTFRPWDQQLRQSLHLVEINPDSETRMGIELLVGELPAIYMPGTDPIERLDQLGDLAAESSCSLR